MIQWTVPNFSQKLRWAEKFRIFKGPDMRTPGWQGDANQRPFLFDRWCNRPNAAKALYWKLKKI